MIQNFIELIIFNIKLGIYFNFILQLFGGLGIGREKGEKQVIKIGKIIKIQEMKTRKIRLMREIDK